MIERQDVVEQEELPVEGRLRGPLLNVRNTVLESAEGFNREMKRTFIANPMQLEVTRFRRRFINVTASPRLNQTLVALVVFSYLLIMGVVFVLRADLQTMVVAFVQLVLMMLTGVVSSHAAIAGEKDRRSWDLLQMAPVTQYQIVVGKFIGTATMLLALQLVFLPAILMTKLDPHGIPFSVAVIIFGSIEIVCLAVSLFISSATIYLSSKLKSANATLVAGIGTGVGIYFAVPLLASVLLSTENLERLMVLFHPFYWLIILFPDAGNAIFGGPLWGLLGSVTYLFLTGLLLFLTGRRLTKQRSRE